MSTNEGFMMYFDIIFEEDNYSEDFIAYKEGSKELNESIRNEFTEMIFSSIDHFGRSDAEELKGESDYIWRLESKFYNLLNDKFDSISNEGHDYFGALVCKKYISSLDELRKIIDILKNDPEVTDSPYGYFNTGNAFRFYVNDMNEKPIEAIDFDFGEILEWAESNLT